MRYSRFNKPLWCHHPLDWGSMPARHIASLGVSALAHVEYLIHLKGLLKISHSIASSLGTRTLACVYPMRTRSCAHAPTCTPAHQRLHTLSAERRSALPSRVASRCSSARILVAHSARQSNPKCGVVDCYPFARLPLKRLKPLADQGFQCRDTGFCGSDRRRSGDLSIFSRTLYQLSYRAMPENRCPATLTGLEPATSAVTGRRANQLRHRALCVAVPFRHEEKLYQSFPDSATFDKRLSLYPQRDSNPCRRRERAVS